MVHIIFDRQLMDNRHNTYRLDFLGRIGFWILLSFVLLSCEKEVDVIPRDAPPAVVVEASIENGGFPFVLLSNSFSFFDSLGLDEVEASFIRGAKVTVSDGQKTVQLREYTENIQGRSFVYYTIDRDRPAEWLFGKLNTKYQLEVVTGNDVFTAKTSIPDTARRIVNMWWEPVDQESDSGLVRLHAQITDPPGLGNYVRWYTSVNDSAYNPGFGSVVDDALIDGTTYDIQILRAYTRDTELDRETFGYFRRGEKVKVKISNIDKATFDFWRTWEQNASNLGNPFGMPVKIISNIEGGATGYFAGYATQVKTIYIPD